MSLPTSRDLTINNGDPIPSALLNKLQDCVIGQKKPSVTRCLSPYILAMGGGSWSSLGVGYVESPAAAGGLIPLAMDTGDRLTGIVISSYGTGALTVTHTLLKATAAMVGTTLLTVTDVNRAAAWGDFNYAGLAAYVLGAGECLYLDITVPGSGCRIGNVRYTIDRL